MCSDTGASTFGERTYRNEITGIEVRPWFLREISCLQFQLNSFTTNFLGYAMSETGHLMSFLILPVSLMCFYCLIGRTFFDIHITSIKVFFLPPIGLDS